MKNILIKTDLMTHLLLQSKGRDQGSIIRLQVIKFENG